MPTVTTDKLSGSCNHVIFLCLANLQNCSLLVHVFSISTKGALQVQDRSRQLRPVASQCVCDWLCDATGLDCGDRPWICNMPQLRPFSTNGLILIGNHLLAPDKLNTISFIHDNYTYLLNSDSEWTANSEYHFFFSQVNYYRATLRLIGRIRGQQQQQHDLVYAFEVVLLDWFA